MHSIMRLPAKQECYLGSSWLESMPSAERRGEATVRPRRQGRRVMAFIGAKRKPLMEGADGSGAGFRHEGQLAEKSILRGINRRRSNLQISKAGTEMFSPIFSTLQLFARFVGDGPGSQPEFILVFGGEVIGRKRFKQAGFEEL